MTIVAIPTAVGVGLVTTLSLGPDYAGLGALAGLVGLLSAMLIAPFTGTSQFQFNSPGPAAAGILSGLAASVMAMPDLADEGVTIAELALDAIFLCALLVGIMHILIGQLRLGNLIKLVPHTVITGIMNGVLIIVAIYQLPMLLGLPHDASFTSPLQFIDLINWADLAVGFVAIGGVYVAPRLMSKVPPLLFGMVVGTLAHWALKLAAGFQLGPTIGLLPVELPTPARAISMFDLATSAAIIPILPQIMVSAIAITLVTGIGALVTASAADALTNGRHEPRGELTGLGASNIVAAIFSGIPSGGSPTSVMLNYESGGRTRASHIFATLLLLSVVVGLGPLIATIPMSVIAGVLIVMSIRTFDNWPMMLVRKIMVLREPEIRRNLAFNLALISVVTLLILITDLMTAVLAGLVLELLHFLLNSGDALVRQTLKGGEVHSNVVRDQRALEILHEKGDAIQIVSLQGALFFGNTDHLASYLEETPGNLMVMILDFKRITDIDSSGALVLGRVDKRYARQGQQLLLVGLPEDSEILDLIEEYGLTDPRTEGRIFDDMNAGLAYAEELVLQANGYDPDPEIEMPLDQTVPFKDFSAAEIGKLGLRRQEVEAGHLIIREGDEADGLHILVKGRVSIQKREAKRQRAVSLVEFGAGVNLGEMAILGGGKRTADVVALQPSIVYFMPREVFEALCRHEPSMAVKILINVSGSLSRRLAEASVSIAALESY